MDRLNKFIEDYESKLSNIIDKKRRLYFDVKNEDLREIVTELYAVIGCRLSTATGMEMEDGLEILYHFSDDETGQYYCPRVIMIDKEKPEVNSIVPIVKGAEWIEREIFDFWGVNFIDHPRMEKLLTLNHPDNLDKPMRMEANK
jgi:NADH-quinone oxidoreductase subunit C